MPGSDLVQPLAALAATDGVPVALVGSSNDALRDATKVLKTQFNDLSVVAQIAPAYGLDPSGEEAGRILKQVKDSGARLCFLALGAPKQELLAARGRREAPAVGFASVGAGLDFLGGHQRRAPQVMRTIGLEWLWRALGDPVRLIPRYVRCFAILPHHIIEARKLNKVQ